MLGRISIGLCVVAAACASAGAAQAAPKAKSDPNKVVCRNVAESGSRLKKKRVCLTMAEWAEMRRDAKEQIDHIQNNRPASGN